MDGFVVQDISACALTTSSAVKLDETSAEPDALICCPYDP